MPAKESILRNFLWLLLLFLLVLLLSCVFGSSNHTKWVHWVFQKRSIGDRVKNSNSKQTLIRSLYYVLKNIKYILYSFLIVYETAMTKITFYRWILFICYILCIYIHTSFDDDGDATISLQVGLFVWRSLCAKMISILVDLWLPNIRIILYIWTVYVKAKHKYEMMKRSSQWYLIISNAYRVSLAVEQRTQNVR